jgi:hypothetical protein
VADEDTTSVTFTPTGTANERLTVDYAQSRVAGTLPPEGVGVSRLTFHVIGTASERLTVDYAQTRVAGLSRFETTQLFFYPQGAANERLTIDHAQVRVALRNRGTMHAWTGEQYERGPVFVWEYSKWVECLDVRHWTGEEWGPAV